MLKPRTVSIRAATLVFVFLLSHGHLIAFQDERWTYVSDQDFASVAKRTIWLSKKNPAGVEFKADLNVEEVRFGLFQFGSIDSRYLALALTISDPQPNASASGPHEARPELYIDLNRDQILTNDEKVQRGDKFWESEILAEFPVPGENGKAQHSPRTVRFRINPFGESLSYWTSGYLAGQLKVGPAINATDDAESDLTVAGTFAARISDADGDGRFCGPIDLLWIDLNRDGEFDSFTEKLTCGRGIVMEGRRYQLVADELATRFELRLIEGTGNARFIIDSSVRVVAANLLLVGKDGTTVAIQLSGWEQAEAESLPVGQYRVSSLSLTAQDPLNFENWNYAFSSYQNADDAKWFVVEKDRTTSIEPLADLRFRISLENQTGSHRPGELLRVTPKLTTSSGLMINNCWRGEVSRAWIDDAAGASIRLSGSSMDDEVVACSGFR